MKNVRILESFFAQEALSHLRDRNTNTQNFRFYSDRLSQLLIESAIQDSDMQTVKIVTPISQTTGVKITEDFVIVPILRSGVAMLPAALHLLPKAKVGFAGIYRDERTALPHEYYWKIPRISAKSTVLILDPMLATGNSLILTVEKLLKEKPKEIRIVSMVGSPQGIKNIHKSFPDIMIFLASVDSNLNSQKFIVPGLGDFGDRFFETPTDLELMEKGKPNNRHWYE